METTTVVTTLRRTGDHGLSRRHALLIVLGLFALLGPASAQHLTWERLGPSGGHVQAVITGLTGGELFAGTARGVYYSRDNGEHWELRTDGIAELDILSLAINPAGVLLAGTAHSGVFRSTDNGLHWRLAGSWPEWTGALDLVIGTDGSAYAATNGRGVLRLAPGADAWSPFNTGLTGDLYDLAIDWQGIIYGGGFPGLFRLLNSADSWTSLAKGPFTGNIANITTDAAGNVFVAYEPQGVYRSSNQGVTWTRINGGLTNLSLSALTIDHNGVLFVGTNAGSNPGAIYRSADTGRSWQLTGAFSGAGMSPGVDVLALDRSGALLAGTYMDGLARSTDGGNSWTPWMQGMSNSYVTAVTVARSGSVFAGTINFSTTPNLGVYHSTDEGITWTPSNAGLSGERVSVFLGGADGRVYAGTAGSGVYSSADDGASWSPFGQGGGSFILCMGADSAGGLYAGTSRGLYRYDRGTDRWMFSSTGVTDSIGRPDTLAYISSLGITAAGHIFVGSGFGVSRSIDGGASWGQVLATNGSVTGIAVTRAGHIFVGSGGDGIYRSTDDGATWVKVNNGLTDVGISALAIDAAGALYAGTSSAGVFRSTDDGASWARESDGLSILYITVLAPAPNGRMFAGTSGGGVYRTGSSTVGVETPEAAEDAALVVTVERGDRRLDIAYRQRSRGEVSVELYDMAGSRVGRYDAGYREAGQVHLTMSPKGLPSGPYLVAVSCAGTRVASSIVHLLW